MHYSWTNTWEVLWVNDPILAYRLYSKNGIGEPISKMVNMTMNLRWQYRLCFGSLKDSRNTGSQCAKQANREGKGTLHKTLLIDILRKCQVLRSVLFCSCHPKQNEMLQISISYIFKPEILLGLVSMKVSNVIFEKYQWKRS